MFHLRLFRTHTLKLSSHLMDAQSQHQGSLAIFYAGLHCIVSSTPTWISRDCELVPASPHVSHGNFLLPFPFCQEPNKCTCYSWESCWRKSLFINLTFSIVIVTVKTRPELNINQNGTCVHNENWDPLRPAGSSFLSSHDTWTKSFPKVQKILRLLVYTKCDNSWI